MAQVARGTKANGTTSWNDGDVLYAAELNTDEDTIYTEFNGNIDDDNVKAAAGINPTKINDLSADSTAARVETNPGVSGSESLATTISGEIQRLRYVVHARGLGTVAQHYNGSSTPTLYWGDQSVRGPNLARNGSFELKTGGSTTAPDGWTKVGSPTSLTQVATDVSNGTGYCLRVLASGASQGVSQTFKKLKASTAYFVQCRFSVTTGSMRLVTTGADVTTNFRNVDITKTGSTWGTVAAVILTDSTPTDIVIEFLSVANLDDFYVDNVEFYEMGREIASRPGYLATRQSSTNTGALTNGVFPSGDALSRAVTVPGPGYTIRVTAACRFNMTAVTTLGNIAFTLNETPASTGTPTAVDVGDGYIAKADANTGAGGFSTVSLGYLNTAATPGETYTYSVNQTVTAGVTGTSNGGSVGEMSWLAVELIPPG